MKYAIIAATLAMSVLIVAVVSAQDTLRFHRITGDWSITYGTVDSEIGRVIARGVRKAHIRYSLEGPDGFAIGRRNGKVSYDGTSITDNALLLITARDKTGKKASVTIGQEVQVTVPKAPEVQRTMPATTRLTGSTSTQSAWKHHPAGTPPLSTFQIEVRVIDAPNDRMYKLGDALIFDLITLATIRRNSKLCFYLNVNHGRCADHHNSNGNTHRFIYKIDQRDKHSDSGGVRLYSVRTLAGTDYMYPSTNMNPRITGITIDGSKSRGAPDGGIKPFVVEYVSFDAENHRVTVGLDTTTTTTSALSLCKGDVTCNTVSA